MIDVNAAQHVLERWFVRFRERIATSDPKTCASGLLATLGFSDLRVVATDFVGIIGLTSPATVDARDAAIRDAITWHEDQRKGLSKQPRADHWMMHQHQEQIDAMEAVLATAT